MPKVTPLEINSFSLSYAAVPFAKSVRGEFLRIINETGGALHTIAFQPVYQRVEGYRVDIAPNDTYTILLSGIGILQIVSLSELPISISSRDGSFSLENITGSVSLFYTNEGENSNKILEIDIKNERGYVNPVYVIKKLISEK
jgi:hypothetical protein